MDYHIHEIFYTNIMVTTNQIISIESHTIKKEKTKRTPMQNYQTALVVRNTWDEKQKKCKRIGKRVIK